jgi:uncharacterized protein YkwD
MSREGYTGTPWTEVATVGWYTPAEAINAWRNSPGHWAALLDPNVDEAGLGYAYYATSQFPNGWIIDLGKSH